MTTPITATTPIQSTVAPKNGVAPATPQPPAAPVPPPDASAAEVKTWREKAEKAEALAAQKTRDEIINRRKWEGERKSFGEKLTLADKWAKLEKLKGVDPLAAAKLVLGDKALELLQTQAVNGGAPSAEAVALQLDNLREETEKKFLDREAAAKKAQEEAAQAAEAHDRGIVGAETAEFYKAVAAEYPGLGQLGDEKTVGGILAANISGQTLARYRQALQLGDAETRVAILRKTAQGMEDTLYKMADGLVSHEKYAPKFRDRLTPAKPSATVAPVVKVQQSVSQGQVSQSQSQARRTLTTDLTGTTPSEPSKYRSDDERLKATLARYAENASKT